MKRKFSTEKINKQKKKKKNNNTTKVPEKSLFYKIISQNSKIIPALFPLIEINK